jgi:hypothetical protein
LPLIARWDLPSPIHELVTKLPLCIEKHGVYAYSAAGDIKFPVQALEHFAMGIFWKAAVRGWHNRDGESLIKLGPYEDPVRACVHALEGNSFPDNMALMVTVLPAPKIPLLIGVPS